MTDPIDEASRMQVAELSNFGKLTHEELVTQAEALVAQLRPLLTTIDTSWPEFNTTCAKLRGLAFNAFMLSRKYMERATSQADPGTTTLEDLGL